MADVLKGNFDLKTKIEAHVEADDLESRFEREAMKKLGGSITFVAKKKVNWGSSEQK